MNKVWTDNEIIHLLVNNNRAVDRAVMAIYNRQTESEKSVGDTRILNGIGFSGADAKLGTYYARWIMSGRNLSGRHLEKARGMMIKYRKQLAEIANSRMEIAVPANDVVQDIEIEDTSDNNMYLQYQDDAE